MLEPNKPAGGFTTKLEQLLPGHIRAVLCWVKSALDPTRAPGGESRRILVDVQPTDGKQETATTLLHHISPWHALHELVFAVEETLELLPGDEPTHAVVAAQQLAAIELLLIQAPPNAPEVGNH